MWKNSDESISQLLLPVKLAIILDNNPDEAISIMPYDLESLRDSLEVEVELR